jgi:hypothetical protein
VTAEPRIDSRFTEGVLGWYPIFGSTGMWAIHLVGLASLARFTCTVTGTTWMLHVITVVTGVGAAIGALLAWRAVTRNRARDDEDTDAGRRRFVALLGLVVSLTNVLLIAGEEAMVFGFMHNRCG